MLKTAEFHVNCSQVFMLNVKIYTTPFIIIIYHVPYSAGCFFLLKYSFLCLILETKKIDILFSEHSSTKRTKFLFL